MKPPYRADFISSYANAIFLASLLNSCYSFSILRTKLRALRRTKEKITMYIPVVYIERVRFS